MPESDDWFRESFRSEYERQSAALGRFNLAIFGKTGVGKSTLINAVFGEEEYPSIVGRIAMPSLFVQAAAPFIGAILIDRIGATGALAILFASSITALTIVVALIHALRLPAAGETEAGAAIGGTAAPPVRR